MTFSGGSSSGKVALKMMCQSIWEAEYYKTLYYNIVPNDQRALGF